MANDGWDVAIIAFRKPCRLPWEFGMKSKAEIVKLAPPRDWVAFLAPPLHQAAVETHVATLLRTATSESRPGSRSETICRGEIPYLDDLTVYEESEQACREELASAIHNGVRLRLACGEAIAAD